ncbi:MAG: hypothetical protein QXG00_01880 [Candidatus Woesearchaeota archaeon]
MNKINLFLLVVLTVALSLNIVSAECSSADCDKKPSFSYVGLINYKNNTVLTNTGISINFFGLEKNDENWISIVKYPTNPENIPSGKIGLGMYYVINSGFKQNEFTAIIQFNYSEEEIKDLDEESLEVYYLTDQGWKSANALIDYGSNKLIVKTHRFSMFTILGEEKQSSRSSHSKAIYTNIANNEQDEEDYNCTSEEYCNQNEIPEFTTISIFITITITVVCIIIIRKK